MRLTAYQQSFSLLPFPGTALRALQGRCDFCVLPFHLSPVTCHPSHSQRS